MTTTPIVVAVGHVDDREVAGSRGVRAAWRDLGTTAPGNGRALRTIFGRADDTFRRLDPTSRALVLAGEAAGIADALPAAERGDAALVVATELGCLDADLQFARSLGTAMCDAPVFPYTLPSTCLGELALRLGLRGATICLSNAAEHVGESLAEARRMLGAGEVQHALVATAEVFSGERLRPAVLRVVLVVVAAAADGRPAVAPWPGCDPGAFAALARSCT